MNVSQIGDTQRIKVEWELTKNVKKFEIILKHKDRRINSITLENDEINKCVCEIDGFYGNINVELIAKRGLRNNCKKETVKLFADEYNIAPLTATMPVTLFSLNMAEITNNGEIPTFVWFKRSDVWNYAQMPQNVYTMPVATNMEIRSNSNQKLIYKKTSEWIKELYTINPNSHFNFYYNDYDAYGWMQATFANGIPTTNYNVTLLSDGAASLTIFNKLFTADDVAYIEQYNEMKNKYKALKTQISTKKYYSEQDTSFEIEAGELRKYAYIMAKEEKNVTWWLSATRNAIYDINNVDEGSTLKKTDVIALESEGKIVCKSLSASFKSLSNEQQNQLKKLYKFGDDLFKEVEQQNKKVMIILGTWKEYEEGFEDYVVATMAYYGHEDYIYYYKGHPRNPTQTVYGKMDYLNSLGLTDLDATITAELLFLYYPNLFVCTGYDSSTYESLTDVQSGSIWNFAGGKNGFTNADKSYINNIDACFSFADKDSIKYGSYVEKDNVTILIEEIKNSEIYLYDTETKDLKHLTLNRDSDVYDLVK